MKTVIFLHHPLLNDTFAYFPLEKWDRMGNRLCYATDGGMGACSPDYAAECQDATDEQAQILQSQLVFGYDYKLTIKKKIDYFTDKS